MKNNSISDFVAASMDAVLKSDSHKSLFGTQYKFASDENDAKCDTCGKDPCECSDSDSADDNDAKKKKLPPWLHKNFGDKDDKEDKACADDSDSEEDSADACDANYASSPQEDEEMEASAAFNVAIDSLLTASAALDSVGMSKTSAFSLKLASFVVEAKKSTEDAKEKAAKEKAKAKEKAAKEKEKAKLAKEKEKAAKEKAKEKEQRDTQMAKDKASKEKAKMKELREMKEAKEEEKKAKKNK